ncbi:hypothetical protein [Gluconobacter sp. P5E10]|uniref:hypothetical protein n=1 Tax=Gluconobacter sp. P5E10 TaxID=2762613 RepID=UPI00207B2E18|nr:hypothetical protein [Gluconobacter sp. P5E10]
MPYGHSLTVTETLDRLSRDPEDTKALGANLGSRFRENPPVAGASSSHSFPNHNIARHEITDITQGHVR